jgi:hypothetical protein
MDLQPLVVLRTHADAASSTAVDLQLGGYIVARAFDDEFAFWLMQNVEPEAVVVELGTHETESFVARLDPPTPLLVMSSAFRTRRPQRAELISAVDRLLVDQNLMRSSSCFAEAAEVE